MYGSSFISVTRRPRASRIAASEAAAMPLPSEDTTPPVTKTRGVTEPGEVMGNGHPLESPILQARGPHTHPGRHLDAGVEPSGAPGRGAGRAAARGAAAGPDPRPVATPGAESTGRRTIRDGPARSLTAPPPARILRASQSPSPRTADEFPLQRRRHRSPLRPRPGQTPSGHVYRHDAAQPPGAGGCRQLGGRG